jgi:nucleotide-binding universal stress UspA family protein
MFKKILVPMDGSDLAAKIIPQVEDLAKAFNAEVVLLTVGSLMAEPPTAEFVFSGAEQLSAEIKKATESSLAGVADGMKQNGIKVSYLFREGSPAQEIISYASENDFDLIAMATHGRGEIAWVLGSVAERVVSHASVPVLLLRVMETKGPQCKKQSYSILAELQE